MADLFWFSEQQWAMIGPFISYNQSGAHLQDDRRVVSGIVHVLRSDWRWRDYSAEYEPATNIYNRFNR